MRPSDWPEIRHLPLFRNMLQAHFDVLLQRAYAQIFPAGIELIRQGDPADFLHVVMEGSVELYSRWSERDCTMAVVRPVGTFILAACVKDVPYLMSARTLERSRIILLPASDMRAIIRNDPEFAVSIIEELAGCYRAVVRHTMGLNLRNSRERIAAYVLRQSMLAGDVLSFVLPVEKRLLASYLGMTAENLSRAFKSLEGDGLKIDGSRIIITDRQRLADLARLDRLMDGQDSEGSLSDLGPPAPKA